MTGDFVMEAVKHDDRAVWFASEELVHNREFMMEAVEKDGMALPWDRMS